jgi:hypothetical protein
MIQVLSIQWPSRGQGDVATAISFLDLFIWASHHLHFSQNRKNGYGCLGNVVPYFQPVLFLIN